MSANGMMAEKPNSTTPNTTKKPRKERAQLSCTFCRHRKLKCDRQSPCGNCTKRGQAPSCHFTHPRAGRVDKAGTADVQNRVKHLENLVLGLMTGQGMQTYQLSGLSNSLEPQGGSSGSDRDQSEGVETTSSEQTLQALGKLNVNGLNTTYIGIEHWQSILGDIAEVKKTIDVDLNTLDDDNESETDDKDTGPEILLGAGRMPSKEELLEDFPTKEEVDRLVSSYFASPDPFNLLIHGPTFERDYERFWMNPSEAPLTWIGLLYAVMALSTFFRLRAGDLRPEVAEELSEVVSSYRRLAAQCLMVSNYTKPVRWTLEGLMLYNMCEYIRANDTQMGLWIILGVIVRLAMRMGYHRDSKFFPQITPFNGEMRRRVWGLILQLDLLSSVQFGLPRLIRTEQTDTELPGNYLDTDLDENMAELPPPRPDSHYTPISYLIVKGGLTRVFGAIADTVAATRTATYERTLKLDQDLKAVYERMPDSLRVRPIVNSITDSAALVFRRFTLDVLYHKSRCILHRQYIVPARTNERYAFSLQCAVSSAKAILEHQVAMYHETLPGGRLERDRWLMSGLTSEDFALAAMILCLTVDTLMHATVSYDMDAFGGDRQTFINLIESSYKTWSLWKSQPELANAKSEKATNVLGIMLRKMQKQYSDSHETSQQVETLSVSSSAPSSVGASLSTNMSASLAPNTDYNTSPDSAMEAYYPELAPVSDWMDAPQEINWDEWDDLFQKNVDAMDLPSNIWPEVQVGGTQ